MAGLAGGFWAHASLHGLNLGGEGRLVVVRVQGQLALLQLQGHAGLLDGGGSGLGAHVQLQAAAGGHTGGASLCRVFGGGRGEKRKVRGGVGI